MVIGKMRFRLQSVVLVVFLSIITSGEACHRSDRKGLTGFKAAIRLDTSGRLAKWIGRNCCNWEGISCHNATGRVKEISLPGFISTDDGLPFQSEMRGHLSASLTLLKALEIIDLGGLIGIGGTIPSFIGFRLPNLRKLSLYGNKLRGPLPESIGMLLKLEELAVHDNGLAGSIPSSLGQVKNLHSLFLNGNRFSGSIPDSFTNLTNLIQMDLHSNSLTGHIPEKIGQLQILQELDLSDNLLTGKLPISLTNLTALSILYLDNNNLQGSLPFPSTSGQLPSLGFLRLQDNCISGPIPSSFGDLVSLKRASLANNRLEGTIPSNLGNLSSLSELYLNGNRFSGEIPNSIAQLSQLIFLNLSHNFINGPLPQMSSLQNLQTIDLSFNLLKLSSIPQWLSELPSLSKISLAGCGIQGNIPKILQATPSPLQKLDLSANSLTGSIPEWIGSLTQLYSLKLSENSLISEIPDSITNLQNLGVLDLHSNRLTGNIQQVFKITPRFPDGSLTYIDLSDNGFFGDFEKINVEAQPAIQFLNLSHNNLEGKLPASIGELRSILSLDLSHNNLGFELPEALMKATLLETLKLQKNHFTGKIPKGFLKLRELKELDLSDNLLVGEIPEGKPLTDFPRSSYMGNKGLCGKPLGPCQL